MMKNKPSLQENSYATGRFFSSGLPANRTSGLSGRDFVGTKTIFSKYLHKISSSRPCSGRQSNFYNTTLLETNIRQSELLKVEIFSCPNPTG